MTRNTRVRAVAQCPLRVNKCKSHSVSELIEERGKLHAALTLGVNDKKYKKFNNTGLYGDFAFRAHDQLAWKIKCPKSRYPKVPFAVATSNGLYVRFMQDENSKWQVAENVSVDDFASLNCKKLDKLQPKKLEDIKQEFADSVKRCSGYNWKLFTGFNNRHLKECSSFSAKLFLMPDSQFIEDMLAGKKLDTLMSVKDVYQFVQLSVSELNVQQRRQLNKARVAVFKCGEEQNFAWVDIIENQVLMPASGETNKSLISLQKVNWDDRCKTESLEDF